MREDDDYTVRLVDLPYSVGALLSVDEYGYTSIYINSRQSREMQRKHLRHELRHIRRNDVHSARPITEVERHG